MYDGKRKNIEAKLKSYIDFVYATQICLVELIEYVEAWNHDKDIDAIIETSKKLIANVDTDDDESFKLLDEIRDVLYD